MGQHYLFHESGVIPGIPGTFAGCRVDVEEDNTFQITPLLHYPALEEAEAFVSDETDRATQPLVEAAEALSGQEETISPIVSEQEEAAPAQEQPAPAPVQYSTYGG